MLLPLGCYGWPALVTECRTTRVPYRGGDVSMRKFLVAALIGLLGAAMHTGSAAAESPRNGARPRLLATQAGDVELRIPKLRKGSFFPVVLQPRRRIDQALYAVVMEAYVNGVSTRSVEDLVSALGVGLQHLQVGGGPIAGQPTERLV